MEVSHIIVKKKGVSYSGRGRFWEGRIYICLKGGGVCSENEG